MRKATLFLIFLVLLAPMTSALDIVITGEGDWPIQVYKAVGKDMDSKSGNTWTDRSGSADKARQQEVDIGRSDYASDSAAKSAEEIAANLKNASKGNVSLSYKKSNTSSEITVTGPLGSVTRVYNNTGNMSSQADQILKDIGTVSEGCKADSDCEDSDECTTDSCVSGVCVYEFIPCGKKIEGVLEEMVGKELGIPLLGNQRIRIQLKDGTILTNAEVEEGRLSSYGKDMGEETLRLILADESLADQIKSSEDPLGAFMDMKRQGQIIIEPIGFGNKVRFFFAGIIAGIADIFV